MEERIIDLGKLRNGKNTVIWLHTNGSYGLSIVSGFDDTQRIGQKWMSGNHYMDNLAQFAKEVVSANSGISVSLMYHIAETAIGYLKEEELIDDFLWDYGIDLDDDQKRYFGLLPEEDD